jgi:hypothetical protein
MNKRKIIMVIALVCIAVILGIYYEYHNQVAFKVIYFDNNNHTDEETQVKAEATTDTSGNLSYTDEELQELYRRHNITENDLKFARRELPNYLEGTVLHSTTRVLVTETGEPSEGMKEGVDYDVVMSEQEMSGIIKEAEAAYIEKYGVNPADPKLDGYNGYLLPKEEVKRLVSLNMVTVTE